LEKAITTEIWSSFPPRQEERQAIRDHKAFALKSYGKALRLFHEYNAGVGNRIEDEYRLRNTLLYTYFIGTFETYLGNIGFLLKSMVSGLRILAEFSERRLGAKLPVNCIPPTAILDAEFMAIPAYHHSMPPYLPSPMYCTNEKFILRISSEQLS
jgi:hypothetical protein